MTKVEVKFPRQYAQEILQEPSRNKRQDMLAAVPEHLRAMVQFHVEHAWTMRRAGR